MGRDQKLPAGLHPATLAVRARAADDSSGRGNELTQLLSVTANLGDVNSIITHPASTSHGRLTEQQRLAAGNRLNLVRAAAGLEHIDDLKANLARGRDTL
jgi:O-succinylhomoserine sulfhydrylase